MTSNKLTKVKHRTEEIYVGSNNAQESLDNFYKSKEDLTGFHIQSVVALFKHLYITYHYLEYYEV